MSEKIVEGPKFDSVVNLSLGELFFDNANRFSNRICQIDAFFDKSETYLSVQQRSVRVALEMQKRGITSRDTVALCTKVHLDNIIPIIASLYLGAKIANLYPTLSIERTTHLLSLVAPKMIFVEESAVKLIENSLTDLKSELVVFGSTQKYSTFADFVKLNTNEEDFKPVKVDLEEVAFIIFTSGTTKLPKAVCHTHRSLLNLSPAATASNFKSVLHCTSFYWMSAQMLLIYTFINGGQRIFADNNADAELIFRSIEKYKVTFLSLVSTSIYKLTNFENFQNYDTTSLCELVSLGLPLNSVQQQTFKRMLPHVNISNAYGLTEVGALTGFNPKTDLHLINSKIGSCGKPISGVRIKVIDVQSGKSLGPNQKGEIYGKTAQMMKGYYNVENSVFDRDGFFKTGDYGYYDEDECFYIVGRLKEIFKYKGWLVEPSVIESVLLEHPAVEEALVFGTPSEEFGELPTALVVLRENCQVGKEALEEFVAGKVSDHEKLRGGVEFVESFLKTPNGKIMKEEMRKSFLNNLEIV